MIRAMTVLLTCIMITACQHTPPKTADNMFCKFERLSLERPLPGENIDQIYADDVTKALFKTNGDMLFLSGGSQEGAFGAGFIQGWYDENGAPELAIVTGVSTGALQATGSFIGQPDLSVDGYTINRESDILDAYVSGSSVRDGLGFGALTSALRRGAIADLVPLRKKLKSLFDRDVLVKVADGHRDGRRLYVVATDVDLGIAIAFNMGELADRFARTSDPLTKERLHNCYIDALLASSIVPPAAKPVFIDNRMYIDGGVKYAVMAEDVGKKLADFAIAGGSDRGTTNIYIILNADGEIERLCGKAESKCRTEASYSALPGQHQDWEILGLASRSVDMLIKQVERLSIERAASLPRDYPVKVHFAKIERAQLRKLEFPIARGSSDRRTCEMWRRQDIIDDDPLEFYAKYMKCLLAYGRSRGKGAAWSSVIKRQE